MKRRVFPERIILCLALAGILFAQEDFLKVEASIVPRRLSRGQEGEVILKLSFQEGTKISPKPDFTIEFEPCPGLVFPKNFYTATDLGIETEEREEEESLVFREPIRIRFTVSEDAEKGSHILEGRVRYYARSQKKEWCVKTAAKFFVPFFTRSTSVKKKS
ncbi:MAG: hypothetical protein JXE07_08155 [Candidatus Aminicenantes bacterium]|nr:hypothetical protein [Candidatus Aminicenantes bacterium]